MTYLGLLDHIRISVSDRERSKNFWSPVLNFLGFSLLNENEERICYASEREGARPRFLISEAPKKFRDNGVKLGMLGLHHFAFRADTQQQVDNFYQLLIKIGASTQGPPDFYDYSPGYYAVYFRDPDNLMFELVYVPEAI